MIAHAREFYEEKTNIELKAIIVDYSSFEKAIKDKLLLCYQRNKEVDDAWETIQVLKNKYNSRMGEEVEEAIAYMIKEADIDFIVALEKLLASELEQVTLFDFMEYFYHGQTV